MLGGEFMANMEGNVTVGFNETAVENAREQVMNAYDNLVAKSAEFKEPVVEAINACWFGPDSEKFVTKLNEKIEAQNTALKDFFNAVASEDGLLVTLKNEWVAFQDSVTFEDQ